MFDLYRVTFLPPGKPLRSATIAACSAQHAERMVAAACSGAIVVTSSPVGVVESEVRV